MSVTDAQNAFPPHAADIQTALQQSVDFVALKPIVDRGIAEALAVPGIAEGKRFFVAGSGDSYFAALSTAPALARWIGVPVEAFTAIELARYRMPLLGDGDVVVSISNSGSSSRTRECIALAQQRGLPSLGITGSLDGPLAKSATTVIHRPIGAITNMPERYARCFINFAEYIAVLYALYAFGIALGRRRGTLTEADANDLDACISQAIMDLPEVARRIDLTAQQVAKDMSGVETIFVLGAGPSRGTAAYSAAKFHEQMPINGVHQDLEEWAHLEYFLTYFSWRERSVTLVIAPPGNSADRAAEIVEGIVGAGGRALLVAPVGTQATGATALFPMPAELDEFLSPITYHLPAQLLVLYMAHLKGIRDIPLRRTDGARLIAASAIRADLTSLN